MAFPQIKWTCVFDAFPSIDKIPRVTSPVLVIHGTEDEVIDFSHGLAIYERCPRAVEPLWVEGAGHNDVHLYNQYLERLKTFVAHELPARSEGDCPTPKASKSDSDSLFPGVFHPWFFWFDVIKSEIKLVKFQLCQNQWTCWSQKMYVKQFWVLNIAMVGPKEFWVQNILGAENSGPKKFQTLKI